MSGAVLLLLIGTQSATAFDNQRSGFVLGFGVGPGLVSYTQTIDREPQGSMTSDRQNDFALMTDFKIGGAPSNHTQVYWISRVSWFSLDNALNEKVTIANGFGGVGVSHFFHPRTPSMYLMFAAGFVTWATPFESESDTWTGLGVSGGLGYEFRQHWSVEWTAAWGKPDKSERDITASTNALSLRMTFNYTLY